VADQNMRLERCVATAEAVSAGKYINVRGHTWFLAIEDFSIALRHRRNCVDAVVYIDS